MTLAVTSTSTSLDDSREIPIDEYKPTYLMNHLINYLKENKDECNKDDLMELPLISKCIYNVYKFFLGDMIGMGDARLDGITNLTTGLENIIGEFTEHLSDHPELKDIFDSDSEYRQMLFKNIPNYINDAVKHAEPKQDITVDYTRGRRHSTTSEFSDFCKKHNLNPNDLNQIIKFGREHQSDNVNGYGIIK